MKKIKVFSKKLGKQIEVEIEPRKVHPNQKLNAAFGPGSWW